MDKDTKTKALKGLSDAVGRKEMKKGFKPLTDDIYNITKENKV